MIDVDLGAVQERELLAAGGPYNLAFRKVEVRRNKANDGDTIYAEIIVEGHPNESFINYWSLKPGALNSRSASISVKKFFEAIERTDLSTGHLTDEVIMEMRDFRFVGLLKHGSWNGEPRIELETVLEAA